MFQIFVSPNTLSDSEAAGGLAAVACSETCCVLLADLLPTNDSSTDVSATEREQPASMMAAIKHRA
jgi:hypothetical protein